MTKTRDSFLTEGGKQKGANILGINWRLQGSPQEMDSLRREGRFVIQAIHLEGARILGILRRLLEWSEPLG